MPKAENLPAERSIISASSGWRWAAALLGMASLFVGSGSAKAEPDRPNNAAAAEAIAPFFKDMGSDGDPGCAVGAEVAGQTVFLAAHGMASMEDGVPLSARAVLQSGSVAKQVTAFAILLLAERGALSLDDPLSRHLPQFDFGRPVTLRQLLQHTAGVRDQEALLAFAGWRDDDPILAEDVLRLLERQKALGFEPGTKHVYSNSGYILLAAVIEKVAGMSLRDFAQREIFAPLGMRDTQIVDDYMLVVPRKAVGHLPRYEGGWAAIPSTIATAGSSNLFTSVDDMLRWTANLHSPRVGASAVRAMSQTGTLANGETTDYGMGLNIFRYRGTSAVSHSGAVRGFMAETFVLPQAKFGAVVLRNRWNVDPPRMVRRLADALVEKSLTPRPSRSARPANTPPVTQVRPTAAISAAVPGVYRNVKSGALRRVAMADGKLVWGPSQTALVPSGERLYDLGPGNATMRWTPSTAERGALFELITNGAVSAAFERLPDFAADPRKIAAYAGDYWSEELGSLYVITVRDGGLDIAGPRLLKMRGTPMYRDGFQVDFQEAVAEFKRDRKGRVTAFELGTERTPGLRFVRVQGRSRGAALALVDRVGSAAQPTK